MQSVFFEEALYLFLDHPCNGGMTEINFHHITLTS